MLNNMENLIERSFRHGETRRFGQRRCPFVPVGDMKMVKRVAFIQSDFGVMVVAKEI